MEDASKIALFEIQAVAWSLVCGDGDSLTVPGGAGGGARPFGGAVGPVRSTDLRYLSNPLAVFVFWSICEISRSTFQSRPGHTKASFTRGLSSRPRHHVIVQRQRFSRSWAGAVWVWKVSPRGLLLIPGARGWLEGRAAALCGGSGHTSGPGVGGPEPRCATGSFTRFPQNSSGLS